jgi:hypothetical protein
VPGVEPERGEPARANEVPQRHRCIEKAFFGAGKLSMLESSRRPSMTT